MLYLHGLRGMDVLVLETLVIILLAVALLHKTPYFDPLFWLVPILGVWVTVSAVEHWSVALATVLWGVTACAALGVRLCAATLSRLYARRDGG